jgi:signal transduction histidine kinase
MNILSFLHAAMSHDLRGPMNAIHLVAELLEMALGDDTEEMSAEKKLEYVRVVKRELSRWTQLFDQYSRVTGAEGDEKEVRIDVGETLQQVQRLLAPQARRQQVTLAVNVPASPVLEVMGRRDWLQVALVNVAINSLEAVGKQGSLILEARARGNTEVLVSVRDSGPGVPDQLERDIWSLHFTTKECGTGIGLNVARELIVAQQGTLTVRSLAGVGSTVEVCLPRASR